MIRNLIKSVVFPGFLQRFDEKLLLERPWLWATRLHRVAWPALLLTIAAVGLGLLVPVATSATLSTVMLVSIGIVVAQGALAIYWLYGQDSYHVEREHGVHRDKKGWREYGTYIGALSMISVSLFCFLGTARLHIRTMPANELARDLFLVHLISAMKNRDNYLYQEMGMDKYEYDHYDYDDDSIEARTYRERRETYDRINSLRATYETRLARAAAMFIPNNEDVLLDKYIFDERGSFYGPRYRHEDPDTYWNEDHYLADHLDMADLIPLQAEWANGDYSTLYDVLSRYSGESVDTIESAWDKWATLDAEKTLPGYTYEEEDYYRYANYDAKFDRYGWEARHAAGSILDFSFNPTVPFMQVFWSIVGAIIIHLSLMRFTFKHSGLKGFLIFAGCVAGVLFLTGIYMFVGQILSSIGNHYRSMDWYVMAGLIGGLLITAISFLRVRSIPTQTKFKWTTAVALYMLPLFLIATPFLVLGVEELATDWVMDGHGGWFDRHFITEYNNDYNSMYEPNWSSTAVAPTPPWSVAPLGLYMMYFSQFAYVPLLGWFKRKHTRLMSLPRV